jgi:murein DD-endopeptidase MepM/ murein hydrolase activator NlpD
VKQGLVILVLASLCLGTVPALASGSSQRSSQLRQAKGHLHDVKDRIRARSARMRKLQRILDRLATRIADEQSLAAHTEARMRKLERWIARLDLRRSRLQDQLDSRAREAYMIGPSAPLLYLLTATSTAEIASRLTFLDELSRRDALLATKLAQTAARVAQAKGELARLANALQLAMQKTRATRVELQHRLAESRKLYAYLQRRKNQALAEISRIRPFALCPLDGPHAVADNFGVWVHHPKKEGGDHIHQGDDIAAAIGTPILAPFDGNAVQISGQANPVGGLSVSVYGQFGYVYNAHLSRLGQLGPVHTGDVIGYVGETGNASGPHDHFEWHPGNGPAVDPHPFLMLVC